MDLWTQLNHVPGEVTVAAGLHVTAPIHVAKPCIFDKVCLCISQILTCQCPRGCSLFPVPPSLKPLDVQFMKAIHNKVNVVPVIAKADTLTLRERERLKRRVRRTELPIVLLFPVPQWNSSDHVFQRTVLAEHQYTETTTVKSGHVWMEMNLGKYANVFNFFFYHMDISSTWNPRFVS